MSLLFRSLHVLAAITWIGGMVFVALVLVSITRRLTDPSLRTRLFHEVGVRFRAVGWIAVALLVATGISARPFTASSRKGLGTGRFYVRRTSRVTAWTRSGS